MRRGWRVGGRRGLPVVLLPDLLLVLHTAEERGRDVDPAALQVHAVGALQRRLREGRGGA